MTVAMLEMSTRDVRAKWGMGPTVNTVLSWRGDEDVPELYAGGLYLGKVVREGAERGAWRARIGEQWISRHGTQIEAQLALYQEVSLRMAAGQHALVPLKWDFSYRTHDPSEKAAIERQARGPFKELESDCTEVGAADHDGDVAPWFAWRPVRTDRGWRWFVEVNRIREGGVIRYLVRKGEAT